MAPPELARDAPVADVVHPFVPGLEPDFGDDFDALFIDRGDGFFGQRLGADEPLFGDQRLHDGLAALAFAGVDGVVFDAFEQAERVEIGHDASAGFVAIEAGVGAAGGGDFGVASDDFDEIGSPWRLPASKSLGSCAGVILTTPVPNSGSAISSRMMGISRSIRGRLHGVAVEGVVALVAGIDGDGGVAQHGFGAGGGDGEKAVGAGDRIFDVPEAAGAFPHGCFRGRKWRCCRTGTS